MFSIKLSDDKCNNNKSLFKYINKVFKLYLFSIIIYIPINLYNGYFKENNSILSILKDLIFNGTMYHLWYLPALILGMIIVYLLISRFELKNTLIISILLYIVGLFGDSYYGISNNISLLKHTYDILFLIFKYTRNGLFFAPIYITLGYKLSCMYDKTK
ncbi:acyltransferase family protein [Romboutsia sp. Marseille-P6047]|uniref:acyltransferase family protein n=1 Tax=Romboutsia sp. Marseille-P6047 TaxID=2161817 RepID=UPI000F05F694